MAKILGRQTSVGLGKDSPRGTAGAATYWLPWTGLKNDEKFEVVKLEGSYGTIAKTVSGDVTKLWSEHELSGPVTDKGFGLLLYALLGTINSAAKSAPNTAVYDHTFTLAETVTHQSLTINVNDGVQDYQFPLSMIDELTLTYELGKLVEYSVKFTGKKGASATLTVTNAADNIFRPQDFSFKYAADVASLTGASATTVRSFKITFKKNLTIDWNLGTQEPTDINNGQFEVTGEFTEVYQATTLPAIVLAGTKKAVGVYLTNSSVTIGTSANPALSVVLNQVIFDDMTKEITLGDLVMRTYKFDAQYKIADSKMIEIVLTNLATSY